MGFDIHTALQLAWEDGMLVRRDAWDIGHVLWSSAQSPSLRFCTPYGVYTPTEDDLNAEDWSVCGATQ